MIVRTWAARTTRDRAPRYAEHLRRHALPTLHGVDGYAGAWLLERPEGEAVEILVVTLWRSLAAIRGFAGEDSEAAVVADEAAPLFAWFDDRVRHYAVAVADGALARRAGRRRRRLTGLVDPCRAPGAPWPGAGTGLATRAAASDPGLATRESRGG